MTCLPSFPGYVVLILAPWSFSHFEPDKKYPQNHWMDGSGNMDALFNAILALDKSISQSDAPLFLSRSELF